MIGNLFSKLISGWKLTLPAFVLIMVGGVVGMKGSMEANMGVLFLGSLALVGGCLLMWYGLNKSIPSGQRYHQVLPDRRGQVDVKRKNLCHGGGKRVTTVTPWSRKRVTMGTLIPNSMNIYKDRIEFEYVKKPLGMPGKCYNDNQEYFVHRLDDGSMSEWVLPDEDEDKRYYDPKELANVVEMPAVKKYMEWVPSTFQKVAFGIMAVVIAAELITLIILVGNGSQ